MALRSPGDLIHPDKTPEIAVALLTGGGDRPYAFGLATELISKGTSLDVIAGDDLDSPEFHGKVGVRFLNQRGNQDSNVSLFRKVLRVAVYYARLIRYAATAKPRIFHILWNNKLQFFDRTLLMLYYKLLGKSTVLTVHNVNASRRDSKDTLFNRLTLRVQYRLSDHLFVHTEKMKHELIEQYGVQESCVTVIPFGINNSVPNTRLTPAEAKLRLGIGGDRKAILFFGNIAPYKGLEYLVTAFQRISARANDYQLMIAGRPKDCEEYWTALHKAMRGDIAKGRILLKADYVSDDETEIYFKAADVLVLPYTYIYQSGVLFLGHGFGLPVIVADVGSLKDEIVEGETGFVFKPKDPFDLASTIERYFESELFKNLDNRREHIREHATARHSWDEVGRMTISVYTTLLHLSVPDNVRQHESS